MYTFLEKRFPNPTVLPPYIKFLLELTFTMATQLYFYLSILLFPCFARTRLRMYASEGRSCVAGS